jgi:hypothetical protein
MGVNSIAVFYLGAPSSSDSPTKCKIGEPDAGDGPDTKSLLSQISDRSGGPEQPNNSSKP